MTYVCYNILFCPLQNICLTVFDGKQHFTMYFCAALEICINLVEYFNGKKTNVTLEVLLLQFRQNLLTPHQSEN